MIETTINVPFSPYTNINIDSSTIYNQVFYNSYQLFCFNITSKVESLESIESFPIRVVSIPQYIFISPLGLSNKIETQQVSQTVDLLNSNLFEFKKSEVEDTFITLVNLWRSETRGLSSTNKMSMHPAYQQIIGMGSSVVPLLLRELEKKSGRWFWALQAITRDNPVPSESNGKTREMTEAWLDWGRKKGYKW